jgi:hypothetical protein
MDFAIRRGPTELSWSCVAGRDVNPMVQRNQEPYFRGSSALRYSSGWKLDDHRKTGAADSVR